MNCGTCGKAIRPNTVNNDGDTLGIWPYRHVKSFCVSCNYDAGFEGETYNFIIDDSFCIAHPDKDVTAKKLGLKEPGYFLNKVQKVQPVSQVTKDYVTPTVKVIVPKTFIGRKFRDDAEY